MKNVLIAIFLVISLCGCYTSQKYYLDPNKKGYTKKVYEATCLDCTGKFRFSRSEYDKAKDGRMDCPRCGKSQDMAICCYQLRFDEMYK